MVPCEFPQNHCAHRREFSPLSNETPVVFPFVERPYRRVASRCAPCAGSSSATKATISGNQTSACHNNSMQSSTAAISTQEKGTREPLTLYYLVFVFAACSFLGLIVETVVSYFVDGHWESRVGFVWGPFSPIYGVGGVLITLALHRFENASPLVIYALSAAFGAAFEYFAAWFWESAFGIVAWSYIDQPFNIGGKTCLGIALVWGLAGLAWVKLAAPALKSASNVVPNAWREPIAWALLIFFVADAATTVLALDCWMHRLSGLKPESALQQFFALHYGDGAMQAKFETMSMYPQLATLRS